MGEWKHGRLVIAEMRADGITPNSFIFGSLMNACSKVERERQKNMSLLCVYSMCCLSELALLAVLFVKAEGAITAIVSLRIGLLQPDNSPYTWKYNIDSP